MSNANAGLLAAVITCLIAGGLCAEQVSIRNDFVEPISLWSWPLQLKNWLRPALYIPRQGRRPLNIDTPGLYYVVARDQNKRDFHIGWMNLHESARKYPGQDVVIDGIQEVRTATFTVKKYRQEVRTRVCYGRQETYSVWVPYSEEVNVDYQVWTPYARLPSGEVVGPGAR